MAPVFSIKYPITHVKWSPKRSDWCLNRVSNNRVSSFKRSREYSIEFCVIRDSPFCRFFSWWYSMIVRCVAKTPKTHFGKNYIHPLFQKHGHTQFLIIVKGFTKHKRAKNIIEKQCRSLHNQKNTAKIVRSFVIKILIVSCWPKEMMCLQQIPKTKRIKGIT